MRPFRARGELVVQVVRPRWETWAPPGSHGEHGCRCVYPRSTKQAVRRMLAALKRGRGRPVVINGVQLRSDELTQNELYWSTGMSHRGWFRAILRKEVDRRATIGEVRADRPGQPHRYYFRTDECACSREPSPDACPDCTDSCTCGFEMRCRC
jgi:hypothetical protein